MLNKAITVVLVSMAFCNAALAESLPVDMKPELAKTVGDMLLIDAALAHKFEENRLIAAMGKKTTPPAITPVAPIMKPLQPPETEAVAVQPKLDHTEEVIRDSSVILLGIFGVNDNLYVDVQIDNERVRYQRGRSSPISGNPKSKYRLAGINSPCIELIKGTEKKSFCLEKDSI